MGRSDIVCRGEAGISVRRVEIIRADHQHDEPRVETVELPVVDAIDDVLCLIARHPEIECPVLVVVVLGGIPNIRAASIDLSALDVAPVLRDGVTYEYETCIW